jgi:imidazolonepropionase-like amidohydrolase
VRAAGEEARRAGLPLIVHATGLAEAKAALRAGARLLVHSVWDASVDEEFVRLARETGTIYCPTLTVARGYVRMFEAAAAGRAPQVDDPNGCVHPSVLARVAETAELGAKAPPAERLSALGARVSKEEGTAAENLRRMRDAGIPIALGTDAGNPLTLHGPSVYSEAEAMQAAGMTAMEVLVAATRGGAQAMGKEQELGTVEAGKAADLLVLAADPTRDIRNLRQLRSVGRGGELRAVAELRPPSPPAVK